MWTGGVSGGSERGALKEGFWADITVFDFERIQDRATYQSPMEYPEGISWVMNTTERSSFGSTQKMVDAAPPQ